LISLDAKPFPFEKLSENRFQPDERLVKKITLKENKSEGVINPYVSKLIIPQANKPYKY